jgi:nucleotide-binding universal stress UspA family protein
VAVDDSPAALTAARLAVALADRLGASVRFVHVQGDGELVRRLAPTSDGERLSERRTRATRSLLLHVLALAERAEVPADTVSLEGEPAAGILTQARHWGADLLVLGRSGLRRPGQQYVGAVSRNVLELSDVPVLVVPRPGPPVS